MNDDTVSSVLDHSKMERPSSDRCRFFRVIRQQIMQNIIDEGKSPISRFKICRDVIDLFGSQHMFRANKVSSRHCKVILGVVRLALLLMQPEHRP